MNTRKAGTRGTPLPPNRETGCMTPENARARHASPESIKPPKTPGEKKTALRRFFFIRRGLQGLNRFGLGAFQAFSCHEGNALVFFERLEAGAFNVGVVD